MKAIWPILVAYAAMALFLLVVTLHFARKEP